MATQIQLRRDTAANWTANNPTLAAGEFAWESDTNKFKIGDGTTAWTSLAYASDGDTAGITFVGDDSTGTLVAQNETFKIAGTQNITTAVSGDTLTITGPDLTAYSTFSGSYTDLTDKPTIPTNNNELTNGAGYITASSTDTLTNKSGNISQFTNDSGYKTAVSEADVTQHQAALSITESQISDLSHFSGDYTDLTNKPTIPGSVSELLNDTGFITNSTTTIVGDDSTGTTINSGETFKIAGTQNVSTAVSGDTLTITGPDLSSYASTSYVDTAVSNLVDTAPETLNTLNELAAALGDDANFATTTSTALGNRLRVDTAAQGLNSTQKSNAITNLGLATVATSGAYSDLSGTPTIPTNNNQLTNGAGYITGYSVTEGDVTAHQAALSITESQISDLGSYITASSTDTLTNKSGNISQWTNDAGYSTFSGSYTDLTNKPTIPSALTDLSITDGTSGQVLTTDGAGNFTFTTVSGGGTITALNNQAENRLVTIGSTTTELDGEANLTFDGSTLTLTGTAALDGVTIADNTISTNASNADLEITANGTGSVALGSGTIDNTVLAYNVLQSGGASERGATRSYTKTIDWSTASSSADRIYGNTDLMAITVSGSGTGNSRERVRQISAIQIDTAGYNLPYQHGNYQANTNVQATELRNSSATASTVREITGNSQFVKVGDNGSAGNITVTDMTGNASNLSIVAPTGTTMSVTNAYGSIVTMEGYGGSGTVNLTNYYGFYVDGNSAGAPATNHYGFYVDDDSFNNRIGGVTLQNGAISTDGITIDDNKLRTSRSNDPLWLFANGTGYIGLNGDPNNSILAVGVWSSTGALNHGTPRSFSTTIDFSTMNSFADMLYPHSDLIAVTMSGSGDGASTERVRNLSGIQIDSKGYNTSYSSTSFDSLCNMMSTELINTSASASTHDELTGLIGVGKVGSGNNTGNITVTDVIAMSGQLNFIGGSATISVTNAYGQYTGANSFGGATVTNYYGLYVDDQGSASITNPYGVYVKDSSYQNVLGGVTLQNGAISTDGITINDNEITTSRSNDNLNISANGTGRLVISANGSRYEGADSDNPRNIGYYEDTAATFGAYSTANLLKGVWKIDSGQSNSTSSSDRWRNTLTVDLDLNGKSSTATSSALTRGPQNIQRVLVRNSGGADVTLGNVNGGQNFVQFFLQNTHDMTVTEAAGHSTSIEASIFSGRTLTLPNAYGYHSSGLLSPGGGGTLSATNFTHFYAQKNTASATNEYGFYAEDGMSNYIGGVTLQNGTVSTDGIDIVDNEITTNRSNDNLVISANGTGQVELGVPFDQINNNTRYNWGVNTGYYNGAVNNTRIQANNTGQYGILAATDAGSNTEWGSEVRTELDMAGYSMASNTRGAYSKKYNTVVRNDVATASTINLARSLNPNFTLDSNLGDITINTLQTCYSKASLEVTSGRTGTITDAYAYYADGPVDGGGGGTNVVTNSYGFYVADTSIATNQYGFWDAGANLSRFGAVILANQAGDPATVTDSAHIYAKDDAGSSEVYVRDEAGNVTKISPHNEAGEWEYYSVNKNTGKTVRINMERAIKLLEQLTGEKLIENQ